jgi:hypothetical protein
MIEILIGAIGVAIPVIQGAVGKRLEHRDLALTALYMALTETENYMQQQAARKSKKKEVMRDPDKEKALAALWFQASIPIKHFDKQLASLCEHKREYWSNPAEWRKDPEIEKQIKIGELQKKLDGLRKSVITAFTGV